MNNLILLNSSLIRWHCYGNQMRLRYICLFLQCTDDSNGDASCSHPELRDLFNPVSNGFITFVANIYPSCIFAQYIFSSSLPQLLYLLFWRYLGTNIQPFIAAVTCNNNFILLVYLFASFVMISSSISPCSDGPFFVFKSTTSPQ